MKHTQLELILEKQVQAQDNAAGTARATSVGEGRY